MVKNYSGLVYRYKNKDAPKEPKRELKNSFKRITQQSFSIEILKDFRLCIYERKTRRF